MDKRDTDYNDYRVFEGRQYRISAKDEQALEQLRLLHLERKTRSNKPLDCCGSDDEDDEQTLKEKKEVHICLALTGAATRRQPLYRLHVKLNTSLRKPYAFEIPKNP